METSSRKAHDNEAVTKLYSFRSCRDHPIRVVRTNIPSADYRVREVRLSHLIDRRLKAIAQIDVLPHFGQMLGAMDIRCASAMTLKSFIVRLEESSPHARI
jgi:hypothetical protein